MTEEKLTLPKPPSRRTRPHLDPKYGVNVYRASAQRGTELLACPLGHLSGQALPGASAGCFLLPVPIFCHCS